MISGLKPFSSYVVSSGESIMSRSLKFMRVPKCKSFYFISVDLYIIYYWNLIINNNNNNRVNL